MTLETKKGKLTFRTWIACGFGVGFAPQAPGTIATFFLAVVYGFLPELDPILGVIIAASLCLLGVYLCGHAEKLLGHDAGSIVWDEFAGFAVAVWAVPKSWPVVLAALMIFRFFDIVKPPPAGAAQRLPGGWGIVADDIVAGIYTNLALRGLLLLIA
ncbi:MAG: phosphatidylglycerophosphatase A [Candidatus Latescibacteria bacterium]|nr:phosphatidylglycerophosphatase A [Candidatus Latescibacterota bacterium]